MDTPAAAIFDLDGTLLDSMGIWGQIDVDFLAKRGIEMPSDYTAAIAPMGFNAAAEYTKKRFHLPESCDDMMREWTEMAEDHYAHAVQLKPYAGDYLRYLSGIGVPMAVATASREIFWRPAMDRLGILPLFQNVTTIQEVSRGKGFPDVYLLAVQRLGISDISHCVVYEDIPQGIHGAKSGGFFTVGVYDQYCKAELEMRESADLYIRDFRELLPGS